MPGTAAAAREETESPFLPLALGGSAPPAGLAREVPLLPQPALWGRPGLASAWPSVAQGGVAHALPSPYCWKRESGQRNGALPAEALAAFTSIH